MSIPRLARADDYEPALTRAVLAKERALDDSSRHNWEVALRLFLEVRAVRETKEAMYELGLVAAQLGQNDLAVEAYSVALELGLSGSPQQKAKRFVLEHGAKMAQVTVTGPADTVILVANRQRGVLPLKRPLVLLPGKVSVQARLSDGRLMQGKLELAAGSSQTIRLGLSPSQSPEVSVARAPTARAPTTTTRPAPPTTAPPTTAPPAGGQPAQPVPEASDPRGEPAPTPAASTANTVSNVLLWSGGVVAALSALAVPLTTSKLESARADLPNVCPEPKGDSCPLAPAGKEPEAQQVVDDIATYKALRTGAWVSLGVGGALLASGLGLKYLGSGKSDSVLRLSPAVGGVRVEFQRSF